MDAKAVGAVNQKLHLLRPFSSWRDGRVNTVDEAVRFVDEVREAGLERFYTWTRRRIAREADLKGGSVYFVKRDTLFRMPFIEIEVERGGLYYSVVMEPRIIRVEPLHVGFLRRWRYQAPADLVEAMPGELQREADRQFEEALLHD